MRSPRIIEPSTTTYALRGLVATILGVVVAGLLVAWGAGALDTGVTVSATIPPEAGRVSSGTRVVYQGVAVGTVTATEGTSGTRAREAGTDLTMRIDAAPAKKVPAAATVRAVPRTLFGDMQIELLPPARVRTSAPIASGDRLAPDASGETQSLYGILAKADALLASIRPERLTAVLTALSQALDGRGASLGESIGAAAEAANALDGPLSRAADSAGDLASLGADVSKASPDLVRTLRSAVSLTQQVADRPRSLTRLLGAGLALAGTGRVVADENTDRLIEVVRTMAPVGAAVSTNPAGVRRTLEGLGPMAEGGRIAFSSGRFSITAVPDFSQPRPYGPEDCPRYPGENGSTCGAPAPIDAAAERQTYAQLGGPAPGPADWMQLSPMLRGNEVRVR